MTSSGATRKLYRAAVDGPLGMTFHDFTTKGGGVIVTDRVVKEVAEVMGLDPAECELVTITDKETGALLWPKD